MEEQQKEAAKDAQKEINRKQEVAELKELEAKRRRLEEEQTRIRVESTIVNRRLTELKKHK